MEHYPTRRTERLEPEVDESFDSHGQAIRFMLNVINATIYSSGEDYEGALADFFPQIQALGHLIGAMDIDDISAFLRRHCRSL